MDETFFSKQLDGIIQEFESLESKSQYKDLSDLPKSNRQSLVTRSISAIRRISGADSAYAHDVDRILERLPDLHLHTSSVIGVVKALREDLKSGYFQTLMELAHGGLFADFLEMSQHLLDAGYKDAAAVLAGATLESHIRELCKKAGLDVASPRSDGSMAPKKADVMNSELAKANVYTKLDQKSVTAWLDLRNKAAHGNYAEYSAQQVGLLVSAVREFLARNPA